jgi:hypothetical protein
MLGKEDAEVGSLTRVTTDSFAASGRGVDEVPDAIVRSGRHE